MRSQQTITPLLQAAQRTDSWARGMTVFFLSDASAQGGAEKYQTVLAEECVARGAKVCSCIPDYRELDSWSDALRRCGASVTRSVSLARWLVSAIGAWRDGGAIVHLNGSWKGSFGMHICVSKVFGIKAVITEHSVPVALKAGKGVRRFSPWRLKRCVRGLLRRMEWLMADEVVVVSETERRYLVKKHGLGEACGSVIANGVDCSSYKLDSQRGGRVRDAFGLGGQVVIGSVGRLDGKKGYGALIDMAGQLRSYGVKVLIVGDGPDRCALTQRARDLGIERDVVFAGWQDDVVPFVSAMDVFALPSEAETLPFSILEAMSIGKPVVATDVGGVRELVQHDQTGYIVERGARQQFTERLLALVVSAELRQRFGAAAREFVESHFSQRAMLAKTMGMYERLCRRN